MGSLKELAIKQMMKQAENELNAEKKYDLPQKRMCASEREAYMRLWMFADICETTSNDLANRAALVPGMKRDMALMRRLSEKYLNLIRLTIPIDQRLTMDRNGKSCTYVCGARKDYTKQSWRQSDEWGIWMSYADLQTILDAMSDHCLMCDFDREHEGKCELRKTFDRIGVDIEHSDGRCGYREHMI